MAFLPIYRLVTLGNSIWSFLPRILTSLFIGTVVLFSIIVLGLSAHVTWFTTTFYGGYYTFAALSIATAILSILTLPTMSVLNYSYPFTIAR